MPGVSQGEARVFRDGLLEKGKPLWIESVVRLFSK